MTTYPRLTHAETLELLERAQAGDIAARNALIEANMGLVVHLAKYYQRYLRDNAVTVEDLAQDGVFGLMAAIDHFQLERGNQFSTVAYQWVRQAIQRAAITAGTIKRACNPKQSKDDYANRIRKAGMAYLDEDILHGNRSAYETEVTLLETIASDQSLVEDITAARLEVERIFCKLEPHHQIAVWYWGTEGATMRDACKLIGVSKSRLGQIVERIRKQESIE